MKARVKATGETGIVARIDVLLNDKFTSFSPNTIELLQDYADISPKEESDYWTHLEHQYAGMAMQGILSRQYIDFNKIIENSVEIAHALVEKLKEEE